MLDVQALQAWWLQTASQTQRVGLLLSYESVLQALPPRNAAAVLELQKQAVWFLAGCKLALRRSLRNAYEATLARMKAEQIDDIPDLHEERTMAGMRQPDRQQGADALHTVEDGEQQEGSSTAGDWDEDDDEEEEDDEDEIARTTKETSRWHQANAKRSPAYADAQDALDLVAKVAEAFVAEYEDELEDLVADMDMNGETWE